MLPGEEGEDRARAAGLVAIVEVVGARIVEIHRLLDQPQSERPGVEVEIALRGARDRGDVMNAVLAHVKPSLEAALASDKA
jgi:hypothetical protein